MGGSRLASFRDPQPHLPTLAHTRAPNVAADARLKCAVKANAHAEVAPGQGAARGCKLKAK